MQKRPAFFFLKKALVLLKVLLNLHGKRKTFLSSQATGSSRNHVYLKFNNNFNALLYFI